MIEQSKIEIIIIPLTERLSVPLNYLGCAVSFDFDIGMDTSNDFFQR